MEVLGVIESPFDKCEIWDPSIHELALATCRVDIIVESRIQRVPPRAANEIMNV